MPASVATSAAHIGSGRIRNVCAITDEVRGSRPIRHYAHFAAGETFGDELIVDIPRVIDAAENSDDRPIGNGWRRFASLPPDFLLGPIPVIFMTTVQTSALHPVLIGK